MLQCTSHGSLTSGGAVSGLVVGLLTLLTVVEPRKPGATFLGDPLHSSKFTSPKVRSINASADDAFAPDDEWLRPKPSSPVSRTAQKREEREGMMASVTALLTSRAFQARPLPSPCWQWHLHEAADRSSPGYTATAHCSPASRFGTCGSLFWCMSRSQRTCATPVRMAALQSGAGLQPCCACDRVGALLWGVADVGGLGHAAGRDSGGSHQ